MADADSESRRWSIGGVVAVLVGTLAVGLAVLVLFDGFAARPIGPVTGTVVTLSRVSTKSAMNRPTTVVVDIGGPGYARATNTHALALRPGTRVELAAHEGQLVGFRWYRVERVLDAPAPEAPAVTLPVPSDALDHLTIAAACLGVMSVLCLLDLWLRQQAPALRKLGWSAVLLVPLFGPLLYWSLFEPVSVQKRHLRGSRYGQIDHEF